MQKEESAPKYWKGHAGEESALWSSAIHHRLVAISSVAYSCTFYFVILAILSGLQVADPGEVTRIAGNLRIFLEGLLVDLLAAGYLPGDVTEALLLDLSKNEAG